MNQSFEEVNALRQRLLDLEQSHRQCQQQVEQLTQELNQEKAARQQVEDRLQLILASAQMVSWDMDLTTYRVVCSPNALQVWGIQEGTGEDFFAVIHPDDRQQVIQAAERAVVGERDYFQEYRVIRPDGVTRWLSSQGQVYLDETGRGIRMIGLSVDVTERKQAEIALRESDERLRIANDRFQLAAKAVNCLIYDWYLDSDRVERTDGLTRLLGYSLDDAEPTGQWWRDRIHPDDLQAIQAQASLALAEEDYFSSEYRVLNQSNQYIYVLDQCLVVERDADGNPTRIVGSTIDISEHKRAQLQLQQSQRFIQQIADAMPGTLYVYDMLEHRNVYVNRQIGELLGYTPEQVQIFGDQLFPQLMHPDDLANLEVQIQRLNQAQDGEVVDHEYRMRHANGEWRWLWSRNTVSTRTPDGLVHQVVGTVHDITDRKQTEAELQQREQEFRTLVENTPDIIVRYDRDQRHLYINPSIEQAVGVPPEQFIGKTGVELGFTDERSQSWYAAVQQVFETGQSCLIEYEFPNPEGELRLYQVRFVPELMEEEHIATVLGVARDVTEYKQAEASLRRSEERLRLAMEGAQMGTWDADLSTGKAIWSEQHFTMLGYQPIATGDASEEMWSSRIHPDDWERTMQAWQQSRQDHALFQAEYRVIRADNGEVAWLAALGSFTYSQTGEADRSVGIVFDISDRKQAEAALAESNQTLQAIIQACPLAIMGLRADGTVQIWNPAAERIFGWSQDDVLGKFLPAIPSNKQNEFLNNLALTIQGQGLVGVETQRQKKGNILFDVELWSAPVDETKAGISCVAVVADITARKQTEAALRLSEERLHSFVSANVIGILFGDLEGGIQDANDEFLKIVGYTREDLQAGTLKWIDITPPEYLPLDEVAITEARQRRACTPYEKEYIRKDGSRVPVLVGFGLVLAVREEAVAFILDLSDRKQAEVEREQLLRREQFAREQAEAANRVKDEFLAVLSHELRTPLNPILGWTRLLRTRQFDAAASDRALETIERNAKLQAQLIEDLLDVSRILQGKLSLNVCPVNLVTTIEAALETVRLSAEAKGIQIQMSLDSEVGPVNGDGNRLQQVMWNLLSNAVKFTPEGGQVTICLELIRNREWEVGNWERLNSFPRSTPCSPGYAQVTVSDTGQGISPDFLPYVFEYFRQADSSTTRQFGGLGLGLAIVRCLVELHGGTVKAESPGLGMGATFTVQLPLQRSEIGGAWGGELARRISASPGSLTGLHILIVDDEADMRDLIRFILAEHGAMVRVAASATEALQQITESVPDILISDIGMPEMDGYALMRQVRATVSNQRKMMPTRNHTDPIGIALTAFAGEINQHQALSAGFQLHLAKPIEPDQLVNAIAQVMAQPFRPS